MRRTIITLLSCLLLCSWIFAFESRAETLLNTWTKRSPVLADSDLLTIAGKNGKYVAAGLAGNILISSNLTDWLPVQTAITGNVSRVTYGPASFVALSDNKKLFFSTDGSNWSAKVDFSPASTSIRDVAYGNGLFCAITSTNSTLTSPDGNTWTVNPAAHSIFGNILAFMDGNFITSTGTTALTPDGVNWTFITNTAIYLDSQLLHLNNKYFRIPASPPSYTANSLTNSTVWTALSSSMNFTGAAYGNGKYVAISRSSCYISDDAVNWTQLVLSFDTEFLDAAAIHFVDGKFIVVGKNGAIATSSDGTGWTARTNRGISGIFNVDHQSLDYVFNRFVILNYWGVLLSEDGVVWNKVPHINPIYTGRATAYSDDKFIAAGVYGSVKTTTNLLDWDITFLGNEGHFNGAAYGKGLFVVAGEYGKIYTSPDATNWFPQNSGITTTIKSLAFGNNVFVAVGDNATILTSTNGTNWSFQKFSGNSSIYSVAFGGGRFMAVGYRLTATSIGGFTWTAQTPFGNVIYDGVAYVKDQFIFTDGSSIRSSINGLDSQTVSASSLGLNRFKYGRDRVVGIGSQGRIYTSVPYLVTKPSLSDLSLTVGNQLTLRITGEPCRAFDIQHSSDFLNWTSIASLTNRSSFIEFSNSIPNGTSQHFYRAIYP